MGMGSLEFGGPSINGVSLEACADAVAAITWQSIKNTVNIRMQTLFLVGSAVNIVFPNLSIDNDKDKGQVEPALSLFDPIKVLTMSSE